MPNNTDPLTVWQLLSALKSYGDLPVAYGINNARAHTTRPAIVFGMCTRMRYTAHEVYTFVRDATKNTPMATRCFLWDKPLTRQLLAELIGDQQQ